MGQVIVFVAVSGPCGDGWHLWCPGGTGSKGKGRQPCKCECHGGRPLMAKGGGRPAHLLVWADMQWDSADRGASQVTADSRSGVS